MNRVLIRELALRSGIQIDSFGVPVVDKIEYLEKFAELVLEHSIKVALQNEEHNLRKEFNARINR